MNRYLYILILILLIYIASAEAQSSSNTVRRVWNGATDPTLCRVAGSNIFYNTVSGLKICTATNTWTLIGAVGGTIGGTGTTSQLAKFTATSTIGNSLITDTGLDITIPAAVGSSVGTGSVGGALTMTAGNAGGDGTVARIGGAITITAGNSVGNQTGPNSFITGGAGGAKPDTGTASGVFGGAFLTTGGTGGTAPFATVASTGGQGGVNSYGGGAGGTAAVAGTGNNTGGQGGGASQNGGSGGGATGITSGANVGGKGGLAGIAGGTGGLATGGATNTGGAGGDVELYGGLGRAAATADGVGGVISFYTSTGAFGTRLRRWTVTNAGHFISGLDNAYDIGATGATRPRTVYVGTDVIAGGVVTATGAVTGATIVGTTSVTAPLVVNALSVQGVTSKTLTEASATGFVDISVASGSFVGGRIDYTVNADDATDFQVASGSVFFTAVNKAGTVTTNIGQVDTEVQSVSASTLVNVFTATAGTLKTTLKCNATSGLTQTTLSINYRVIITSGLATVTAL